MQIGLLAPVVDGYTRSVLRIVWWMPVEMNVTVHYVTHDHSPVQKSCFKCIFLGRASVCTVQDESRKWAENST